MKEEIGDLRGTEILLEIEMMIEERTGNGVEIGMTKGEIEEGMKMTEEVGGMTIEIDDEVPVLEGEEMMMQDLETVTKIEDVGTKVEDPEIVMMKDDPETRTIIGEETMIDGLRAKELEKLNGEKILLLLKVCDLLYVSNRCHISAPIPWGGIPVAQDTPAEPVEKELPSLKPSGKLLEDTNMVNGVVVKYVEPPEAKAPKAHWQLHPFRVRFRLLNILMILIFSER